MSGPEGRIEIHVRLFAMLRERAGSASLELSLPRGSSVADALRELRSTGEHPALGELLSRMPVGTAVNREYADAGTILRGGDELALIPPVSGGSVRLHARVTEEPLSVQALSELVSDPACGAVVVFQGVTREVAALDYEAYREMAGTEIASILERCAATHGLRAAAAEHRIGRVPLGEPSVIVAVSAPHRAEAFAGAREAIDEIKARAPVWKREPGADGGADWVQGKPAPGASPLEGPGR